MCLGDEFARLMLFMFVGGILSRFKISVDKKEDYDMEGECGITLTPKRHLLIFHQRK